MNFLKCRVIPIRRYLYYLRSGQITDFAAFQKLKKSHDELLQSLGNNGDSNDESAALSHESVPAHSDARPSAFPIPKAMDCEPDEIIPTLPPGGKGLKIDKITTLRRAGGLLNYQTWLQEASTAFLADPHRFNTKEKRVDFAALNMDSYMRDLWAHAQTRQPQLVNHWKKFQRWAEESHLRGNADFDKALQQFHDASQAEHEDPMTFYTRLSKLAAAIEMDLDMDYFFARLNPGLRRALIRTGRKGSSLNQLLRNALEVWGTFANKRRRKRTLSPDHSTTRRNRTQRPCSGVQTQQQL